MDHSILKKYPLDKKLKKLIFQKEKYEKRKKYLENREGSELQFISKNKIRRLNKNEFLSDLKVKIKNVEIKIAIRICETENYKKTFYDLHK